VCFEVTVVDDHSTDGSRELLEAWVSAGPGRRLVPSEGTGLVDALNTGLRVARAPLIARMDADDIAHPRRLELQRAFLHTRTDVAVVGSLVESFPRPHVQEGYRIYERWLNALVTPDAIARAMYIESPLPHPSVMFRGDLVRAAGGYRAGPFPEDYDLWLRLHRAGHRFAKVPEILLRWRDHPARASRQDPRYAREAFLALKAHHLARGPLVGKRAYVWGAGRIGRILGRALIREGAVVGGYLDIDPRKIGRRLRGRPVGGPGDLPAPGSGVLLAAVGVRDARILIRRRAEAGGYREGVDFFAVA
jgi:glycosyltransferase involved in cell wall biosynthesis